MTGDRPGGAPTPALPAVVLLAVVLLAVALLAPACSSGGEPADPVSTTSPTAAGSSGSAPAEPEPADLPRAEEVPAPPTGACYRLDYDDAIASTTGAEPVDCARAHTALTFAVGDLDVVQAGHLLAVDSVAVRDQAAQRCPAALPGFLGGDLEARRLSMLRTVWFTPTVAESDTGAQWYRCDVIALGAEEELAELGGDLRGILGRPEGAAYGMCGTAAPDAADFTRLICGREHSWRAIDVVDLGTGEYPGEEAARQAGQGPCEEAGRTAAADPLDFSWAYEYPSAEQWQGGQTYGRCWAPD